MKTLKQLMLMKIKRKGLGKIILIRKKLIR